MFVFLRVDSAQAHCVRACPVISAGLGRTSTNERQFLSFAASSPRLVLSVLLCASLSQISQLPPQWSPSGLNATLIISFKRAVKPGRGHRATSGDAKRIIPLQAGRSWTAVEGTSPGVFLFPTSLCLLKVQNQLSLQGFYL